MSKDKGDISETKVLSELVEEGYSVSIPYGDNQRYDLIADDGEELHRVQVKTGNMKDGVIRFECRTTYLNHNGKNEYNSYTKDEIDSYAVWSSEMGEVYWIPVEDAGDSAMTLRISEDIERVTSQTNWAKDYKL